MATFFDRMDEIAGIAGERKTVRRLDRTLLIFVLLTFLFAPHSIAATQIAWLTGMFVWFIRLMLAPRPKIRFGRLDAALWALFLWTAVTSFTSYAPDISIDKLRGAAVFLIFYFAYHNLRTRSSVYLACIVLIVSSMVVVIWTPVQRLIGRGVEIHGLAPGGPVYKALLWEGDTLLAVNGKGVASPEEILAEVERAETAKVTFYRPDFDFSVDVKRIDILPGATAAEKLGFQNWKKSRNWRSRGFYGHYTTFAETLQLIGALVFGLFISLLIRFRRSEAISNLAGKAQAEAFPRLAYLAAALATAVAGFGLALLFTVTRASQLAFLMSSGITLFIAAGRKWFFAALAAGVPVVVIGLLFLQQSRNVGFFDQNDDSIKYRQTIWREGVALWTASPRNFVFGVGMDSLKRYAKEWKLFDDGRLPMGHFHSNPLQLLVERGIPALLLWLTFLAIYARSLWRALAIMGSDEWLPRGIVLGCLGAAVGFFVSGFVHYNLGDQEVAMVFFLLMAVGVRIAELPPVKGQMEIDGLTQTRRAH